MKQSYFKIVLISAPILLAFCSFCLFAQDEKAQTHKAKSAELKQLLEMVSDTPTAYDYTLLNNVQQLKKEFRVQKEIYLQSLISGLIHFSESQYDKAIENFYSAKESDYIEMLVRSEFPGGLDVLIKTCRDHPANRNIPASEENCSSCNSIGWRPCTACRGLGEIDGETCHTCQGLGAKQCTVCRGTGLSVLLQTQHIEEDPHVQELLAKAVYLKNGGVDFIQPDL